MGRPASVTTSWSVCPSSEKTLDSWEFSVPVFLRTSVLLSVSGGGGDEGIDGGGGRQAGACARDRDGQGAGVDAADHGVLPGVPGGRGVDDLDGRGAAVLGPVSGHLHDALLRQGDEGCARAAVDEPLPRRD